MPGIVVGLVLLAIFMKLSVFKLKEWERGVVLFFGKYKETKGPGLRFILPLIEDLYRVDTRTVAMDIPTQDVITKDNISIKVNAVLYLRVVDPAKAITQVENYLFATSQIAQTRLRSVCGEVELDDLLMHRDVINHRIQEIVDKQTDPWGMKVSLVELKHIDLPQDMQRAMAKQAEAERERRAKIIKAEGEFQASEQLTAAAKVMSQEGITIQLRYLETLRDIAAEHNSTILFPMPLEFFDILSGLRKKERAQ